MRASLLACWCSLLVPLAAQAQVQFVPYNPDLPPFRGVPFSQDIYQRFVVNPVPPNQVFVVANPIDLLRRQYLDAGVPVVADLRFAYAAPTAIMPNVLEARPAPATIAVANADAGLIRLAMNQASGQEPNDARYQGWFALSQPAMQERMGLNALQRAEVEKALATKGKEGIRLAVLDRDEEAKRFMIQRRDSRERFLQMLNADQQRLWTELSGDPYEFRPSWK